MRRGSRSLRNTGSPAVVLFAGLTFVLTGCGGGSATPGAGGPVGAAASAPPSASGPAVDGVAVDGTWRGSHTCAQGATGLSLRIAGTDPAALTAVFDFYPLPGNPAVPRGSFTMTGSVQGGRISLTGHEWVSRPAGYEMVNLTGAPRAGTPDRVDGGVDGVGGCTGFSVERATPAES
ncbi:hypothetical protein [Parafrankia discariae]|uniref:hypothetical protein n=1 Tax=Parafrankia discariae TaxID=365528 RepID=UPI000360927F|nr:hypothetical protein [Parafrankia discariae]